VIRAWRLDKTGRRRLVNTYSTRFLEIVVLEEARHFAALEEEWEDLYRSSQRATPFQSWSWLYSWWEHYGEGYELRLITLRSEEGLLVGLIPLMLERRWGFGRLLFVGAGLATPYKDVLIRAGWESWVSEATSRALGQLRGWHVADLQQLRPDAAAWSIFQHWEGRKAYAWEQSYLSINVEPWETLLMSVDRRLRSNARRTVRRAEADGVSPGLVGLEDAEEAARRLVALHRELWRGRDIAPEHLTERFESFIVTAARRMTARGFGTIYEFSRDAEVILSGLMLFGNDFDGTYMEGATQEALKRYQWSSLVRWYTTEIARGRNSTCLSLMDGDPPYKLQWASKRVPSYRMILGHGVAFFWFPYAGYHVLRSKARRYRVESDITPQWAKDAAKRYRILRSRVFRHTIESDGVLQRVKSVTKWRSRR
jgi:hypothetical protein